MDRAPERWVENRRVISTRDPRITIHVAAPFSLIGNLAFALANAADAETFVFVDFDGTTAQRLLVVHFERYRDDNDLTYSYPDAAPIDLDGVPFLTDTFVVDLVPPPPPETDVGRTLSLVRERGLHVPCRAEVQRFIYLPDNTRRSELLVTYAESPFAPKTAEVHPGLRERAVASFRIEAASIG